MESNLSPCTHYLFIVSRVANLSNVHYTLLRRRANARNVSYTPNLSGEKPTISTLIDQTYIQITRQRRKKLVFQLPVFIQPKFFVANSFFFFFCGTYLPGSGSGILIPHSRFLFCKDPASHSLSYRYPASRAQFRRIPLPRSSQIPNAAREIPDP